uniref:U-box domain-containing protein n=1 Tax=Zooxanthella nutricula TaxID=1333877 RepID=A0A7S2L232_9DINO
MGMRAPSPRHAPCTGDIARDVDGNTSAEGDLMTVGVATRGRFIENRLVIMGLLPSLVCPLSSEIMRDPVCAADGWTYERRAIQAYFGNAGKALLLSPVTGQRLVSRALVPCHVVAQIVKQHLPDLPPLATRVSKLQLIHQWQLQEILSYLDAPSLARCEASWPSFLAASAASVAWQSLLARDFPFHEAAAAEHSTPPGGEVPLARARRCYAIAARAAALTRPAAKPCWERGAPASQGLTLVASR